MAVTLLNFTGITLVAFLKANKHLLLMIVSFNARLVHFLGLCEYGASGVASSDQIISYEDYPRYKF